MKNHTGGGKAVKVFDSEDMILFDTIVNNRKIYRS